MQDLKDKVLAFVKSNGPILPVQVSKNINTDMILASAILSELVGNKLIKVSFGKVGGSPLYYTIGQEPKLEILHKHLGEKPKKAYELLKEKQVLRDKICEPWLRVALREIRDFANPLTVTVNNIDEIFWKWHLIPDETAEPLIKDVLKIEKKEEVTKKAEVEERPAIKKEEVEKPKEAEKTTKEWKKPKKEVINFENKIKKFLENKNIKVVEQKWARKNFELDAIIKIPSTAGKLTYYLKAKNKKKINEAELSLAFSEGQERKLPILFVSTGDLTKKAQQYMKERFKGLIFKNV